jgi:hypothetical protein
MRLPLGHFVFMAVKAALFMSLMVGVACSDGSKAGFSGACNSDGDCDSGLVCAQATLGGGVPLNPTPAKRGSGTAPFATSPACAQRRVCHRLTAQPAYAAI